MTRVRKLNIEATDTGVNLDIEGAPEGIHIEYNILPDTIAAITKAALEHQQGHRLKEAAYG